MQTRFYSNNPLTAKRSVNLAKAIALTISMTGGITASQLAIAADNNVIVNEPLSSSNRSHELLSQTLDWVPLSELTPDQREALAPGSCGAYIAPVRTDSDATLDPETAPIRATANRSRVFEKEGSTAEDATQIILIGDVVVTQGYRQIKADQAQLDQESGVLVVDGRLELREPGLLVLGSDAIVKQNENTLTANQATYALQNESIRGTATRIDKTSDDKLKLKSATYTQCAPGNNTWSLKGSQITLNPQAHQGVATNVRLYIRGIPVFYFPYFRFPIGDERLSGFLAPTFNFDDDGFNISTPYYFNLAPNYDLIFTPHIVSGHGALFEGNFRHLNSLFRTDINAAFLSDDDSDVDDDDQDLIDNGTITEEDAAPFAGEDRWLFNLDQTGGSGKRWSTRVDYTKVSDIDYFRDFGDQTRVSPRDDDFLDQRFLSTYQLPNWRFGINAISYQILDESIVQPFTQLPAISADGNYRFAESNNSFVSLNLNHEWTRFDNTNSTDSNTTNDDRPTGDRLRVDYKAAWNLEQEAGFLRPAVALKHLQYNLDADNFAADADTSPSITVPQASIDGGLFFERDAGSYLQTFEPRLFYFYSEFESHDDLFDITTDGQDIDFDTSELTFNFNQLFRDTRFAGGDRIDDANQLSLGLTTRFFSNQSGRELFSASAGQIYFFDDREVTLTNVEQTDNRSAIAAQLTANPSKNWRLSADILYDDENNETDLGNIRVRYKSDSKHVFNVNYRFVRAENELDTVRQVDASFITPLHNNHWHLLAYSAYDTLLDRELDTLAAIEYNGCCYSIRFGFRRELDTGLVNVIPDEDLEFDEQVFIQFRLEGLGGTSGQTDSAFSENINGFDDWKAIYSE